MTAPTTALDATGFDLTTADAARFLDITPGQIRDLMRAHLLRYVVLDDLTGDAQPQVRFHRAQLERYRETKNQGAIPSDRNNIARVSGYLSKYLDFVEPSYEYDDALTRGAPLWVSTRHGRALCITIAGFVAFVEKNDGVLTPRVAKEALEFLRAVRKRGVVAWGEQGTAARWATWWRIPRSLVPDAEMFEVADDAVFGVLEPGDRVSRSPERARDASGAPVSSVGAVYLDGPPLGSE